MASAASLDETMDVPTPAKMLARARALRPMLRAAQADCEAMGQVVPKVAHGLIEGGFFRMVQPRRFGGFEFDVPSFFRVVMEVARGCAETGWVVSLVGGHPMLVARFSEQAQLEVFGTDGDFRCPGALTPMGTATPVDGGYRITHAWVSASGCDLGTHFMGLARIDREGAPELIQMLIEMSDCRIVDDWHVMGMRGTGSKRVEVNNVFVPHHRTLAVAGMERGAEPLEGQRVHANPLYWGPVGPFLISEAVAVAVGAARGALDIFEDILRSKKSPLPPHLERCHDPLAQQQYGTALALVSTAEAALLRVGEEYMECAAAEKEGDDGFDAASVLRLTLVLQRCVQMAWDAIDLVYRAAGTSASAKAGQPIGRFMRNVAVLRTHPVLQFEQTAVNAARQVLLEGAR
jgi:3-hydroxy-9,10-secoandrosta-1,3,5(10)-triene-9,17-dione monooxygenase